MRLASILKSVGFVIMLGACGDVVPVQPNSQTPAADAAFDALADEAAQNDGATARMAATGEIALSIDAGPLKGTRVVVPAGALPETVKDAALSVTHLAKPNVAASDDEAAGPGAEIVLVVLDGSPTEVELLKPASVTLPHTAADPTVAYVAHYTGGKWQRLEGAKSGTATATGETKTFSPFIVLAPDSASAPEIASLAPDQGRAGDAVVITGVNFGATAGEVHFGAEQAATTAWSDTEISATVPSGLSPGVVSVTVTAGDQTSAAADFTLLAPVVANPPVIASLSPVSGPADTVVTVTGTDFGAMQGASSVRFGGNGVTPTSWSATQLVFAVPLVGEGTYDVEVVVGGVTSNAAAFAVPPAPPLPVVSTVDNSWPEMYGQITVSGANFGAVQGTSKVRVDDVVAGIVSWSDTAITLTVPYFDTGAVRSLTVTVAGQTSNAWTLYLFTVPPTPAITSLAPTSGPVDTLVQISGSDFGASQGTSTLRIGSTLVTPSSWTDTLIQFAVPATFSAGAYGVTVTRGYRTSGAATFTVTPTTPSVALVVPAGGMTGSTVALSGIGFGATQGASTLTIGGQAAAITSWSATRIVATVPAGLSAGAAAVVVTVEGAASNAAAFRVVTTGIAALTPATGKPGDTVTVAGTGFGAAVTDAGVYFGAVSGAVQSWSDTAIVVTVPDTVPGDVAVRVRLGAALTNEKIFALARPWIDDAYPRAVSAGASLSLTGRAFGAAQGTVTVDGAPAAIEGWSDDTVQIEIPAGLSAGLRSVVVTTDDALDSNAFQVHVEGSGAWWTESEPMARADHTAVWTGAEMIVWGGAVKSYGTQLSSGARYNPATDTWVATSLVNAPAPRQFAAAVWTGKEMIVTGGRVLNSTSAAAGRYNPATDTWTLSSTTNAPANADWPTAVWTGKEMIVWGGGPTARKTGARYDPQTDTWTATAVPAWTYFERMNHAAVWTGKEMLVWGGSNGTYTSGLNTGGRYDPVTNAWTLMTTTNAPSGRYEPKAVWTGQEMIVWGGYAGAPQSTGGRYDPTTDTWTSMSATNEPAARSRHAMVWTGSEVLVWGGQGASTTYLGNGKRYQPAGDSWADMSLTNAPAARASLSGVWTGTELLVFGGLIKQSNIATATDTGGRYDPAANVWTPLGRRAAPAQRMGHVMVWTGSEVIVFGGFGIAWTGSPEYTDGARYNPATDTWLPVAANTVYYGNPLNGNGNAAVWTGSRMVVWGWSGGGRYDPATDSWETVNVNDAPMNRQYPSVVWTGTEAIFWGGDNYTTGGRYNPVADSWAAMSTVSAPSSRKDYAVVWTGDEMIIWGGSSLNDGARYAPTSDMWAPVTTAGAPTGRNYASAAWTGSAMLIWGGQNGTNTGGAYYPNDNTWATLPTAGAPTARFQQKSVWTGSELIVWGGSDGTNSLADGASFDFAAQTWTALPIAPAPDIAWDWNSRAPAVWTGDSLAVFTAGVMQMYRR